MSLVNLCSLETSVGGRSIFTNFAFFCEENYKLAFSWKDKMSSNEVTLRPTKIVDKYLVIKYDIMCTQFYMILLGMIIDKVNILCSQTQSQSQCDHYLYALLVSCDNKMWYTSNCAQYLKHTLWVLCTFQLGHITKLFKYCGHSK